MRTNSFLSAKESASAFTDEDGVFMLCASLLAAAVVNPRTRRNQQRLRVYLEALVETWREPIP